MRSTSEGGVAMEGDEHSGGYVALSRSELLDLEHLTS